MSNNIVKWNYINFEKEEKHVIDSDSRVDLLAEVLSVPKGTAEAVLGAAKGMGAAKSISGSDGLEQEPEEDAAYAVSEELEAARDAFLKEAEEALEAAKEEAEQILEAARSEAESIKASAYNVGKSDGYKAGMEESQRKQIAMEAELQEKARGWEEEYNAKLSEAEPQFVDIMINLIEKITGVMVENKREVILHLVHNGIRQVGRSEKYVIQCSSEDYPLLEGEKERLCNAAGLSSGIDIVENVEFVKNQCIIEADSAILDCSLDIQLRNLIETLKLLNLS